LIYRALADFVVVVHTDHDEFLQASSRLTRATAIALLLGSLACEAKQETPGARIGDSVSPSRGAGSTGSSAGNVSAGNCGTRAITGNGIGDLRVGMTPDAVRAKCVVLRDTTRLATEGQLARMIAVAFPKDTVEAEIVNGRVWRIEVLSPRFQTADSLGVGTPLRHLLALRNPRGLTGEGQLFVVSPEQCGLSFRLSDNGSSVRTQDWDRAALGRLPSKTVVDKILIVGCDPR
jgi:hypothetical protein